MNGIRTFFYLRDRQSRSPSHTRKGQNMYKKRLMCALAVISMMATGCKSAGTKADYKVAVIKQTDHPSLDEIADSVTERLDELAAENGITIDYGTVCSGQNDASVLQQIAGQVIQNDADVIIPIATLSSQIITAADSEAQIPVVFSAVSDPETAQLTEFPYVTGISDALNTSLIMEMIAQTPDLKTVGLLYSKSEPNSEKPIREAKAFLEQSGIAWIEAVGNTDDELIQGVSMLIGKQVDAVFTPTDNSVMTIEPIAAPMLLEAGIPHYTGADSFVRSGAFLACGIRYTSLGRQTADKAYDILVNGMTDGGTYETIHDTLIFINPDTAESLGMQPHLFDSFGTVEFLTGSDTE